jgi:hypothetical protein
MPKPWQPLNALIAAEHALVARRRRLPPRSREKWQQQKKLGVPAGRIQPVASCGPKKPDM